MPTLLPPIIVAVTRTPIGNAAAPHPPSGITLNEVMDWFDGWVKTFDPALLGVNLEKPIYIYYLRLTIDPPAVEVITPDIMDPAQKQGQNPTPHVLSDPNTPYKTINSFQVKILGFPTDLSFDEISVFLPDMVTLEKDNTTYVRNTLLRGISVQVGTAGGVFSASSLPFPVWLPGPLVGSPIWGDFISFGDKETNYLGLVALTDTPTTDQDHIGGQIRWYPFDKFYLSYLEKIHFDLEDFLNSDQTAGAKQLLITLPAAIVPTMQKFRQEGDWILPPNYWDWDDNGVTFYLPARPVGPERPGFVIIWRDDIPSRLIPFVDVDEYVLNQLKELASQLWQPNVNGQVAVVHIPLGNLVEMGVERLLDAANSLLASALDNIAHKPNGPDLTVQFKFQLVGVSDTFYAEHIQEVNDAGIIDGGYQLGFDPGTVGVSSNKVAFRFKPVCSTTELPPDQSGAFSLQLSALINGKVTLLYREHTIPIPGLEVDIGLPVVFIPEPVVIPTLAIFFYDHFFTGPALVTLPKGTGLFGKDALGNNIEIHYDADTLGQFNKDRQALISKLEAIHTVLKATQMFWDNQTLELIIKVLGIFYSIGMSAVDTSVKIGVDLGECMIAHRKWPLNDLTFCGSISSVVLIGVPYTYSKMVVKCYENTKPYRILDLVLPDDCFIAAIPSFVNLHNPYQLTLVSGENVTIPLPYGNPGEGQPAGPDATFNDFNDRVSSINFVIG